MVASATGCRIEHIGWYGIEVGRGCSDIVMSRNEIHDLGAGGIVPLLILVFVFFYLPLCGWIFAFL